MASGGMPIDGNGVLALPQQENRSAVREFYEDRGITDEIVLEHLTTKYFEFIDAILAQDEKKIEAMAEKRFATKVIANLSKVKANEMKFTREKGLVADIVKEDDTDYGALRANLISDNKEDYIINTILVKGVSVRRDENDCNYDYNLIKNLEDDGLKFYLHKYFTGHMHYYLHIRYEKHLQRLLEI